MLFPGRVPFWFGKGGGPRSSFLVSELRPGNTAPRAPATAPRVTRIMATTITMNEVRLNAKPQTRILLAESSDLPSSSIEKDSRVAGVVAGVVDGAVASRVCLSSDAVNCSPPVYGGGKSFCESKY